MKGDFNFDKEEVYVQRIEVKDIGNSCFRGQVANDSNDYYLAIQTALGKTSIAKFGPVFPDTCLAMPGFTAFYKKIDYNEDKIEKEIDLYLNNKSKPLIAVDQIPIEEAFAAFPMLSETFEYNL